MPDIGRQGLHRPQHLACVHIESHHGIRSGRSTGECIAGCDVKRAPSHIERWRRPYIGAGRRQHVFAQRVFADNFRHFGNGVGLPHFFSGGGIEGGDQSSECAAGVVRLAGLWFFERTDGHVHTSIIQGWSPCDAGERVGIRQCLPDDCARRGIECIRCSTNIAEEDRESRIGSAEPADGETAADGGLCAEGPVHAAGAGVERIDVTGIGTHIKAPVVYGLRIERRRAGKSERPLQLQPRDLCRRQSCGGCGLRSRVAKIGAPAVPGSGVGFAHRRMTGAEVRHFVGCAHRLVIHLPPADPLGDQTIVRLAERGGVAAHRAVSEDVEHMLGRHLLQDGCWRSLMRGVCAFVT